MSRCKACDTILTETECKRLDYNTEGEHLDLCFSCMVESNRAILNETGILDQEINETLEELGFDVSNN